MTWHADCAWWCHIYIRLTSSWACLLCILMSLLCHADIIIIQVSHMGRVNWYSGRVSPSGRRRRMWRVARVASNLIVAWRCVRTFSMSDFDAVFTSGFVSSSFTQWYSQNIILTTFIFEQKSNTTLNHMLWYQLLGISTPPCTDRWCTDSCPLEAKHTET